MSKNGRAIRDRERKSKARSRSSQKGTPYLLSHLPNPSAKLLKTTSICSPSQRRQQPCSRSPKSAPRTNPSWPSLSPPSRRAIPTNTRTQSATGAAASWARKPLLAPRRSEKHSRARSRFRLILERGEWCGGEARLRGFALYVVGLNWLRVIIGSGIAIKTLLHSHDIQEIVIDPRSYLITAL